MVYIQTTIRIVLISGCSLLYFTSCVSKTNQPSAKTDTAAKIIVYPTDSNVPVDTDNHNTGHQSTIALDSPVGPPKHLDTTKLIEQE